MLGQHLVGWFGLAKVFFIIKTALTDFHDRVFKLFIYMSDPSIFGA